MSAYKVMDVNDDLAIRVSGKVHSGKVRSVYKLPAADSSRLIREKVYPIAEDTALAIMIISDRISAFECIWRGENNLKGVPGKGAALNAISAHWFNVSMMQGWREITLLTYLILYLDCASGAAGNG